LADIPIIRPTLPDFDEIEPALREIWATGMVTTSRNVRSLEEEAAGFAGVAEAVAFSSCTSALILALKGMELEGEVVMPSFTFAATAHAAVWSGLTPVFCDCLPDTFTIDPLSIEAALTERTSAIMPVYTFGLPPDFGPILEIARANSLAVVTDAAQGWGSTYGGRTAGGFGDAECFSMSPTKVVTAIEGGLLLTGDGDLAGRLRRLRDYGKDAGGEDMEWIGLSARMSELHAAVGRATIARTAEFVGRRRELLARYRALLDGVPGLSFQETPEGRESSGNYMVVVVDPDEAKTDRDGLRAGLLEHGIHTKRYFYPPVHAQSAYRGVGRAAGPLPATDAAGARALALPLYTHMAQATLEQVALTVRELLE